MVFHTSDTALGLQEMSREFERSSVLAPYRPLDLVASGGFVSVMSVYRPKPAFPVLISEQGAAEQTGIAGY
jgi:hypothetical protein